MIPTAAMVSTWIGLFALVCHWAIQGDLDVSGTPAGLLLIGIMLTGVKVGNVIQDFLLARYGWRWWN